MIELKMDDNEIKFMKVKALKVTLFWVVFSVLLAAFFIGWNYHEPSPIVSVIVILIFLMILFFHTVKLISTRKDIKEGIKIVEEVKITDKHESGTRNNLKTYRINFDSKVLYYYQVTERVYNDLNIDDRIDVAYTKHAIWILSIKSKGINIENKSFMA